MTDDQRLEMIDDQLELMESICAAFVEGDELQDIGNIRAIYEEYSDGLMLATLRRRSISPLGAHA